MHKLRVNEKLTLVLGLDWKQHDPLEGKLRQQIGQWKEEGYKFAAQYAHPGGQVSGLYRPASDQVKFDKTCMAGAAVVATHPRLADQTVIVLIEFKEPGKEGARKVIFVGLRDGKVLVDIIANPEDVPDLRNKFRTAHAAGKEVVTYGDMSGDQRVDNDFSLSELTPAKGGGKACPVTELRSSYSAVFVLSGVALAIAAGSAYYAYQVQLDNAAEMKRRMAMKEQTPQALYTKEIARWSARTVNFVSPSVEFLREKMGRFQVARAGFILVKVECFNEQCTSTWKREFGTLEGFRAAAPPEWTVIIATDQEHINVALDFKLPSANIDRAIWPKDLGALRDKLYNHWQFLHPVGWRASLGDLKQLAIPVGFTDEQRRAISSFPNAPRGIEVDIKDQKLMFSVPEKSAPLRVENFAEQVELTESLVVKYDGKQFSFTLKGIIYVSTI